MVHNGGSSQLQLFAMPIIKGSDQLSVCIVTFENTVRQPQVL